MSDTDTVAPEDLAEAVDAFQLHLSVFDGPLDLLLYLIEREELDITAVSLVQVTDQYLGYIRSAEQIDAAALAEFIAIGARLLLLKSRALLPRPLPEGQEEDEDFGDDLVARLREYKRFKEAAGWLRDIDERGLHSYPRLGPISGVPLPTGLNGVTLDLLSKIVQEVLERAPDEPEEEVIERHVITVEERVAQLKDQLGERKRLSFRAFISQCRTRIEIIVSFMAVLELIKGLQLQAEQDGLFGDIQLVALEPEPQPAAV
jgi:segregation and condensation protein A